MLIMNDPIQSLTSDQAQKALLEFYYLMPIDNWSGGRKPSSLEIEMIADEIQEESASDVKPLLAALRSGDSRKKGEFSKILLQELCEYADLQPLVYLAVSKAAEPTMAPPLIIVGAFLVAFAALTFDRTTREEIIEEIQDGHETKKIKRESHTYFDPNKAVELAKVFTGSFKALLCKSQSGDSA